MNLVDVEEDKLWPIAPLSYCEVDREFVLEVGRAAGRSGNAKVSSPSPGDMGTSDILDIIPVGEPDISARFLNVGSNGESIVISEEKWV